MYVYFNAWFIMKVRLKSSKSFIRVICLTVLLIVLSLLNLVVRIGYIILVNNSGRQAKYAATLFRASAFDFVKNQPMKIVRSMYVGALSRSKKNNKTRLS